MYKCLFNLELISTRLLLSNPYFHSLQVVNRSLETANTRFRVNLFSTMFSVMTPKAFICGRLSLVI